MDPSRPAANWTELAKIVEPEGGPITRQLQGGVPTLLSPHRIDSLLPELEPEPKPDGWKWEGEGRVDSADGEWTWERPPPSKEEAGITLMELGAVDPDNVRFFSALCAAGGLLSVLGSDCGVSLAQLEKAEPKGEQEPPSKPQ